MKSMVCLNCGTAGEYETNRSTGKYCDSTCHSQYRYKVYIDKWLLGEETGNVGGGGVSNYVRRWLFEKHNNACQKCGWSERSIWTNKIPLQVSHVDGDWQNTVPENLELLCPNCHSLTEFHGSLNKGRGRYLVTGTKHPKHKPCSPSG